MFKSDELGDFWEYLTSSKEKIWDEINLKEVCAVYQFHYHGLVYKWRGKFKKSNEGGDTIEVVGEWLELSQDSVIIVN